MNTEKQQESIVWKEVKSGSVDEWWSPAIGDSLQGVVTALHDDWAEIHTAEDAHLGTPSHAVLKNLLKKVGVGDVVRITRVDDTTNSKGQTTFVYKMEVAEQ